MEKGIYEFSKKLGYLIPRITREAFKKELRKISTEDVTLPQLVTLEFLVEKEGCMMKEIAENLCITTSAATGLVDRMIKTGYLERRHDDRDRRVIFIRATKKGRNAIEKIKKTKIHLATKIFGKLSQRERDTYIKILEKIYKTLITT